MYFIEEKIYIYFYYCFCFIDKKMGYYVSLVFFIIWLFKNIGDNLLDILVIYLGNYNYFISIDFFSFV